MKIEAREFGSVRSVLLAFMYITATWMLSPVAKGNSGTDDIWMQSEDAVVSEVTDGSGDKGRALKVDYSTHPPGLEIALLPPSDEEKRSGEMSGPKRLLIGYHRDMPEEFEGDLAPMLEWTEVADGTLVASLSVTSPGATSVRVGFRAELGAAGEIRFFGEESEESYAVVTQEDFHIEEGEMETLWSPTVEGETLGMEISLPNQSAVSAFWLEVDEVAHAFLPVNPDDAQVKQLRCANVHIDVQCRATTVHGTKENAVARIRLEDSRGSWVCTGTLLNDTDTSSLIPYMLTANHCIGTDSVARTLEAWWFYQRARCRGSALDSRQRRIRVGATLLATSRSYDQTLVRLRGSPPAGSVLSSWDARPLGHPVSAYGIHHPLEYEKKYAAGQTGFERPSGGLTNTIPIRWSEGTTDKGSSGSGLFLRTTGQLVGALSHGPACGYNITDKYGSLRNFFPQVRRWLVPGDGGTGPTGDADVVLPLVTQASNVQQLGMVRILNQSRQAGTVQIYGIDDFGRRFGPANLAMLSGQGKTLFSPDLERGNRSLGFPVGLGDGRDNWWVELRSSLDIEARAYIRTPDGFLTSMHQVSGETAISGRYSYHVPFFNPASNTSLRSILRLVNPGNSTAQVIIRGVDARGNPGPRGDVRLSLPGGRAMQIGAQHLEQGGDIIERVYGIRLVGRLGDGEGKWHLYVSSNRRLLVMGLMSTRSGHLSNLSQ